MNNIVLFIGSMIDIMCLGRGGDISATGIDLRAFMACQTGNIKIGIRRIFSSGSSTGKSITLSGGGLFS